jgi:glutamyl/glutaminyl-tRNA synthetase
MEEFLMNIGPIDKPNFLFEGVRLNLRFSPTTNGPLHIGHAYICLLQEAYAHRTGGKFQVRFDDNMAVWVARIGEAELDYYAEQARRDIEWCGIQVDDWVSQRAMEGVVRRQIRDWRHTPIAFPHPHHSAYWIGHGEMFPYAPYETLEKVILDWHTSCNCIVRADDLLTEFSLYYYLCQMFNLAHPDLIYVPRMRADDGSQIGSSVSKTEGGYALADYRKMAWSPAQVRELAAESALIDPSEGWTFENLRERPRVAYGVGDLARWIEDHEED